MTKKYRVKVDTPWARKELVYECLPFQEWRPEDKMKRLTEGAKSFFGDPQKFPEIFEPIPDPVEKVAEWLARNANCVSDSVFIKSAQKLLDAGLDPERLG